MVEMTTGLSGTVACETDAASCVLDAEKTRRAMKIHGPNTVDEGERPSTRDPPG